MIPTKRYERIIVIGLSDKNDLNLNKHCHANDKICLVNVNILYSDTHCRLSHCLSEKAVCSELCQTSKTDRFAEIVNNIKPLNISAKHFILDD